MTRWQSVEGLWASGLVSLGTEKGIVAPSITGVDFSTAANL
jgi:hypothetical protein